MIVAALLNVEVFLYNESWWVTYLFKKLRKKYVWVLSTKNNIYTILSKSLEILQNEGMENIDFNAFCCLFLHSVISF